MPSSFWASPEGELAIVQACLYLATAPKSNAAYVAQKEAWQSAKRNRQRSAPPANILNAPTRLMKDIGYGKDYAYDHEAEDGFLRCRLIGPTEMVPQTYYQPRPTRGFERAGCRSESNGGTRSAVNEGRRWNDHAIPGNDLAALLLAALQRQVRARPGPQQRPRRPLPARLLAMRSRKPGQLRPRPTRSNAPGYLCATDENGLLDRKVPHSGPQEPQRPALQRANVNHYRRRPHARAAGPACVRTCAEIETMERHAPDRAMSASLHFAWHGNEAFGGYHHGGPHRSSDADRSIPAAIPTFSSAQRASGLLRST